MAYRMSSYLRRNKQSIVSIPSISFRVQNRKIFTHNTIHHQNGILKSITNLDSNQKHKNHSKNLVNKHQERGFAMTLFEKMKEVVPRDRERVKKILSECKDKNLSSVTVKQAYNGLRGVRSLICETSDIDQLEGIRFRGLSVHDVKNKLPTPHCRGLSGQYPMVEGMLWLLLTGEIPTDDEVAQLSMELTSEPRINIPKHVRKCIDNLPVHQHPLTQMASSILSLQTESQFAKAYEEGVHRQKYWEYALEDTLNLIARIPFVTARIYRQCYRDGSMGSNDLSLDWSANWCHMIGAGHPGMGLSERKLEMYELMRMYFMVHADHEGGNVAAHTGHLVGSALADPCTTLAGSLCGLAGPLTGLDNSEVSKMIKRMTRKLNGETPTEEFVHDFIKNMLDDGLRIPGFGHPVLRRVDPRFEMMSDFANKYLKNNEEAQIIKLLYKVVPPILREFDGGKIGNPYPNLHMHGGTLLHAYGFKEDSFHPVLSGMSRAFGVLSQYVVDRSLGVSMERPKSVSWNWIANKFDVDVNKMDSVNIFDTLGNVAHFDADDKGTIQTHQAQNKEKKYTDNE